jgi:copper chaperone
METLKFKTNIKCGGCIAKITPAFTDEKRILTWSVDTSSPDRILNMETQDLKTEDVIQLIKKAGFEAEPLTN